MHNLPEEFRGPQVAAEVIDRIADQVLIGFDMGSVDASCEMIFRMRADGTLEVISANTFYRTIDLKPE